MGTKIEVRGLSYSIEQAQILKDVSIAVQDKKMVGIAAVFSALHFMSLHTCPTLCR